MRELSRSVNVCPHESVDLILLNEGEVESMRSCTSTWKPADPLVTLEKMFIDPYGESRLNKFCEITNCSLEYTAEADALIITANGQELIDLAVQRLERMAVFAARNPQTVMLFHPFVISHDLKAESLKDTSLYKRTILESNSTYFEIKMRQHLKILRLSSNSQKKDGVYRIGLDSGIDTLQSTLENVDTPFPRNSLPLSPPSSSELAITLSNDFETLNTGFQSAFSSSNDCFAANSQEGVKGLSAVIKSLQNNTPLPSQKQHSGLLFLLEESTVSHDLDTSMTDRMDQLELFPKVSPSYSDVISTFQKTNSTEQFMNMAINLLLNSIFSHQAFLGHLNLVLSLGRQLFSQIPPVCLQPRFNWTKFKKHLYPTDVNVFAIDDIFTPCDFDILKNLKYDNKNIFEQATTTKTFYLFELVWSENKWNSHKFANLTVDSKSMKVQNLHDTYKPLFNSTWMTLSENWDFRLKFEKAFMLRSDAKPFKHFIESLASLQDGVVRFEEVPESLLVDRVLYHKEKVYNVSLPTVIESNGIYAKVIAVLELQVEKQGNLCHASPQPSTAVKHGRQWYKVEVCCNESFQENLTVLPGEETKLQISENILRDMIRVGKMLSQNLSYIGHSTELPNIKEYLRYKDRCSLNEIGRSIVQ